MSINKRVRLVLLQPPLKKVIEAATPDYIDQNRGHTPPIGLLYIQAAVEHSIHESIFLDANLEGWDYAETASQILYYKPDLVGIQAMTFTLPDAYLVAKALKQLNPEVQVMLGGPHATIYPKETAALEAVDFAFAGEGEVGFIDFLNVFDNIEKRAAMPGIACKINGKISYTPSSGLLKKLDDVYYPARKSSKYMRYSSVLAKRNPITIMITSRGCPFQCIFCNRMGRQYRYHSAQYVLDEIDEISKMNIKEIFIHDDTFSLKRDRVKEICKGIIERRYDIIWEARTRVDCVDEELLTIMRKAGCHRLSFGVESGSDKVLKSIKKGINPEQVRKVFKWCRQVGIVTLADFMFGNLDEEKEDIKKSLQLVKEINPDYIQYSICSPYPGTPLYKLGLERGLIPYDVWLEFARNPLSNFKSPVWEQYFTQEELIKITADAYRTFYMNPSFIFKQILHIRSFKQLRNILRAAMGMIRK